VRALNPRFLLPSRHTLRKRIENLYVEVHGELEKILAGTNDVSLTTDIWTSIATDAYIDVTAHFIDESFNMYTYMLAVKPFPESHTGINICKELKEIEKALKYWFMPRYMIMQQTWS